MISPTQFHSVWPPLLSTSKLRPAWQSETNKSIYCECKVRCFIRIDEKTVQGRGLAAGQTKKKTQNISSIWIGRMSFCDHGFVQVSLEKIKESQLHYTCCITPKRVTSLRGSSTRYCACKKHSSFGKNVAATASRWQHCIKFDRPEI